MVLRVGCLVVGLLAGAALASVAQTAAPPAQDTHFVGDQACLSCHKEQLPYLHTSHKATSALASSATLEATYRAAGEKLIITEAPLPTLAFLMTSKDGRFFQTAESGWGSDLMRITEPVDILVGSDKRGQTFLYWSRNQLFELPVSYWKSGHRWINSPGYIDGTADFHRPVQPGCLECHATAIQALSSESTTNSYEPHSFVAGISCETCHGAGAKHVAAETLAAASGVKKASDPGILNPAHFARDRQLDLCAVCHSGIQRTELAPAFSYVPGEPLARYFTPLPGADTDRPDVHGNQVGLLKRSRCFLSSPQMTCSTCHDVHTTGQPLEAYARKCLTCHQWQSCGEAHRIGPSIASQCIGCHMPLQQTNAIISVTAGQRVQATMRTHWIKVYKTGSSAERQDSQ